MSGNNVDINIAGNDAGMMQVWQRQQREQQKQIDRLEKMAKSGKKAGRDVKSSFNESSASISTMNMGLTKAIGLFGGISGAVALYKKQYAELVKWQENRELAGRTLGEQMRLTRIAFTPDATLKNKDLEKEIQAIADRTKTDAKIIAAAATDAFSAKGKLSNRDALNAVESAFMLLPGNLDAGQTTAARALDVGNRTGNLDMRQNVGFMQNIQNTARVTDLTKVGQNLMPAISAIQNMGDTPEQAAELVVSLNKMLEDANGAITGTAAKALATRLEKFVPEKNGKDSLGKFKVPQEQIDAYKQAKTTAERIKVAQSSPELTRAFLGANPFALEYEPVIKRYLGGDKSVQELEKNVQDSIFPLGKKQGEVYAQKLSDIQAGEKQHLVNAAEASKSNVEQYRLGEDQAAMAASSRKLVDATLDESPSGWIDRTAAWAGHNVAKDLTGRLTDGRGMGNPVLLDNLFLKGLREQAIKAEGKEGSFVKFLDEQIKASDELTRRSQAKELIDTAVGEVGNLLPKVKSTGAPKAAADVQAQAQQTSVQRNDNSLLNAINKQTSVMEELLREQKKGTNQQQKQSTTVPPERRPPYRAAAAGLSVSRDK
tara:strand:+ start:2116 stop:3915 length:1800 start_codon:yes stop_codon:yes gene_type:complete